MKTTISLISLLLVMMAMGCATNDLQQIYSSAQFKDNPSSKVTFVTEQKTIHHAVGRLTKTDLYLPVDKCVAKAVTEMHPESTVTTDMSALSRNGKVIYLYGFDNFDINTWTGRAYFDAKADIKIDGKPSVTGQIIKASGTYSGISFGTAQSVSPETTYNACKDLIEQAMKQ